MMWYFDVEKTELHLKYGADELALAAWQLSEVVRQNPTNAEAVATLMLVHMKLMDMRGCTFVQAAERLQ